MIMSKNIVVYSDGTGQDGGVRPEQRVSNVYKLYRASHVSPDSPIDPKEQVVFYDPGLGTDIGATALTALVRFVQKLLASVTGRGITTNIADCYAFIINHWRPGDRIFLIGFSRGAYTVRCIANLLMLCGVPTKTPSGPLMRFRKAVNDIAEEAVNVVYEHGAGHPRHEFAAEREELARRFRGKYGADGEVNSNAAPHFIGVFDTVASLGAKGVVRLAIQVGLSIGFGLATAALSILPVLALAGLAHLVCGVHFWPTMWVLWLLSVAGASVWWWRKRRAAYRKTIRDFPKPGDVSTHVAEWKDENFDKLLSAYVHYARSANAIDENRQDFQRVGWGGVDQDVSALVDGHPRLRQWWFAGNHSDVGGSYPEVKSRLSDIALSWMIEQATVIPNGLKVGPVFVNGAKMPGTGEQGAPLNLFPAADGVQHCEIAGMRDTIDGLAQQFPRFLHGLFEKLQWPEEMRKIDPEAKVHPLVEDKFKLDEVVQCAGTGAYRPKSLSKHDEFKHYYPPAAG